MGEITQNFFVGSKAFLEGLIPFAFLWAISAKIIWPITRKFYYATQGIAISVLDSHWNEGNFVKKWQDWAIGFFITIGASFLPYGELAIWGIYIIIAVILVIGGLLGK